VVGHGDTGLLLERHRPVAIAPPAIGGDTDWQRREGLVNSVTHAEEIADGTFHTRMFLAIPVHPQCEFAGIKWVVMGDGDPDVRYHSRPIEFRQSQCAAGFDWTCVTISVLPV